MSNYGIYPLLRKIQFCRSFWVPRGGQYPFPTFPATCRIFRFPLLDVDRPDEAIRVLQGHNIKFEGEQMKI
jgi:hypothetical protein